MPLTRALLGLEPDVPAGVLNLDPVLPRGAHSLRIADVPLAESLVTIGVEDDAVALRGIPRGLAMIRRPEPAADRRPPQ